MKPKKFRESFGIYVATFCVVVLGFALYSLWSLSVEAQSYLLIHIWFLLLFVSVGSTMVVHQMWVEKVEPGVETK